LTLEAGFQRAKERQNYCKERNSISTRFSQTQKIWTIRIEKLDEKGTREISGLIHLMYIMYIINASKILF